MDEFGSSSVSHRDPALAPSRGNAELGQKPLRQHYVGNQNQNYWDPSSHASITLHRPT